MSQLLTLQQEFTQCVARLIAWAAAHGYQLTFGEAYRTPEQAKLNAAHGSGIVNSLHCQRLAVDLLAFKDGQYLTQSEDYAPLGAYWKTLHKDAAWGGNFKSRPDGNHFSLAYGGRE